MYEDRFLRRIDTLNVYKRGERRAPHKPLLLLLAIAKLLRGKTSLPFDEVEAELEPLLSQFAPQVISRHQPELPYWHLQSDGLWSVSGAEFLPRQKGGFPKLAGLRQTVGGLDPAFARKLMENALYRWRVVQRILDGHFPMSRHADVLAAAGLAMDPAGQVMEGDAKPKRVRDSQFRERILRAYEHRCAVTGFSVALAGRAFGCEAAHVQWHSHDGPDTVDNGLALEPTIHKLLDAGAWTLSDDRRILVSAELSGSEDFVERMRSLHGRPIRSPLVGEPPIREDYIRWHREPKLGGVFRHPPLAV